MISVAIADDHKMFREGLAALFEDNDDIAIVGEANDGSEVMELLKEKTPQVLLLDIEMPNMDGLDTLRALKKINTTTKTLVLSMHKSAEFIKNSIAAGASGYLQKDSGKEVLVEAIKAIVSKGFYYSSETSQLVIDSFKDQQKTEVISKRETEIIRLIADGLTTKKIAEKLFISPYTVETHRQNILLKLGLKNAAELVKYAVQKGLL